MQLIKNIIKQFIKTDKKVLGRWNIDYCYTKINRKIDSANEDHCGTCVQHIPVPPPHLPFPYINKKIM